MEADVEKRLSKIEQLLLEEDRFDAFERKSFKCAKLILWMFGLASMVLVGFIELVILVYLLITALNK